MPENTALQPFAFHDDTLLLADVDGKPYIALKPTLEAIGLDAKSQIDKLTRKSWARTVLVPVRDSAGRHQDTNVADVRTFLMLLATVDERRVAKHVRPKLVAYQSEVADAIEAYWTRGQVTNPRASSMFEPHTLTWDETTAVLRQRYGIDLTVNELTRMLRTAGVLKQTGGPRKEHRHLLWFTGSSWSVHPHAVPQVAKKVLDTGRELQEFRFIQARLELDGIAENEIA